VDTEKSVMRPLIDITRPSKGVIACVLSLVGCSSHAALLPSAPSELLNRHVAFTLVSNDGSPTTIPLPAKATVIAYWAPTCKPCRQELPALVAKRAAIETAGGALTLVAELAETESTELAEQTLASWGIRHERFLVDHDGVSTVQAAVTALPTTQVYDHAGTLRWVAPPAATPDDVVAAVTRYR